MNARPYWIAPTELLRSHEDQVAISADLFMLRLMAKPGRPTTDPKNLRLTLRLAPRDIAGLEQDAKEHGGSLADAARRAMRSALRIPELPTKVKSAKHVRRQS